MALSTNGNLVAQSPPCDICHEPALMRYRERQPDGSWLRGHLECMDRVRSPARQENPEWVYAVSESPWRVSMVHPPPAWLKKISAPVVVEGSIDWTAPPLTAVDCECLECEAVAQLDDNELCVYCSHRRNRSAEQSNCPPGWLDTRIAVARAELDAEDDAGRVVHPWQSKVATPGWEE